MPLKLNLGLSKKVGLPDYGSLGASCNVEVELDQSLVFDDLDGFHDRVKRLYGAARQAVQDELARQRDADSQPAASGQAVASGSSAGQSNGQNGAGGHRASQKQLDYARQLAGQIRGLGVRKLEALADKMFSKPIADVSSLEASTLIDVLKDVKAGNIELSAVLKGAAA